MLTWAWIICTAGECVRNDTIWTWWCWLDLTWPLQFIRPWSHSLVILVLYCDDHMYRCDAAWWPFEWPRVAEAMAKIFQVGGLSWRGLLFVASTQLGRWLIFADPYRAEPMPICLCSRTKRAEALPKFLDLITAWQHEWRVVCTFIHRAEPMPKFSKDELACWSVR